MMTRLMFRRGSATARLMKTFSAGRMRSFIMSRTFEPSRSPCVSQPKLSATQTLAPASIITSAAATWVVKFVTAVVFELKP